MRKIILAVVVSLLLPLIGGLFLSQARVEQPKLTDYEIRNILRERVDAARKSVGIVVGLVDDKGTRIIGYGKRAQDSSDSVDGNSIFEIGSVSKVFTATLLADMVERGDLRLDDPISKFLPRSVKTPTFEGKEITLRHLSSQTSALPRLPGNMSPKDRTNPYADYSVDQMYSFLSSYTLTRAPGSQYLYSNLGVGLLGHILGLVAKMDYESLIRSRICQPLRMSNTGITLTPEMKAHLATGHNQELKPVANWDLPTLAGAGAIRSNVSDMLKFVAANIGLTSSSLTTAMEKTHQTQHDTGIEGLDIALGWHILKRFDTDLIWHNGGTGGYHSFVGFNKAKRTGVVILSNSTNDIDDIGRHLLESQYPLAKFDALK